MVIKPLPEAEGQAARLSPELPGKFVVQHVSSYTPSLHVRRMGLRYNIIFFLENLIGYSAFRTSALLRLS